MNRHSRGSPARLYIFDISIPAGLPQHLLSSPRESRGVRGIPVIPIPAQVSNWKRRLIHRQPTLPLSSYFPFLQRAPVQVESMGVNGSPQWHTSPSGQGGGKGALVAGDSLGWRDAQAQYHQHQQRCHHLLHVFCMSRACTLCLKKTVQTYFC